jgi:diguanylate cyclase (GGDEF)-like protein
MAFRTRHQKTDRSEVELLRSLVTLANQLQSSLELDAIVGVIASAAGSVFGFREAVLYLLEPDGGTFRVNATLGEYPDYDSVLFERPVPRRVFDELFLAKYQIGSSYFVDSRLHQWTEEQLYYLPPLDLGPRDDDEWQSEDELFVPLFNKKREIMGVLDLYDPADRALPAPDMVKSLEVFAAHAAVAVENARQFRELEGASAQLAAQLELRHALIDLSAALLTTLDRRTLFSRIAALLKDFVDYDAMEIRLVDEQVQELYCGFTSDGGDAEQMTGWRAPLDVGVSGWVLTHNEAQLVNDMLRDPRGALVPGTEWVPQASIIAPLTVAGRVMGVLVLDRLGGNTFAEAELEPARLFANMAAIAIQNARQYEEAEVASRERERQLALRHDLLQLSAALLGTLDRDTVFHEVTTMLRDIVDYDAVDIRLVDEDTRELVSIYARGVDVEPAQAFRISLEEGVTGWVARHGQAQLINDMGADPRVTQVPGTAEHERQASLVLPLTVRGTVTGVLTIDRMGGRTFEESELDVTKLFANMAAIAIQNALAYEEVERQAICDGLTGIHNHRHFHETLETEVRRAERYEETFCLFMMDLDHFKAVNDTVGHQKGDEVLRSVSDVLRSCSRESDYLARYGGEEFAMILPRTGLQEAVSLAQRIRAGVAQIDAGHPALHVTVSVGVAEFPDSAADSDGVLAAADAALLRAKALGRDRVCLYAGDEPVLVAGAETDLVALGRRFAAFIGLSEAETAGLVTALAVLDPDGGALREVQAVLEAGGSGGSRGGDVRNRAVEALVYGHECWDGSGYPEGRRGSAIPRVARAFAVCRRYDVAAHNGSSLDVLRGAAAKELDPVMVQRFAAMIRAESAHSD